jgi:hypothetical protein
VLECARGSERVSGFRGHVSALLICGSLALAACDDHSDFQYPIAPIEAPTDAPSYREPSSARTLYAEGCTLPGPDAGVPASELEGDAGATASSGAPACSGGKVVHFVYFVEADREYSECWRARLEQQAYAMQRYWYDVLGVTFYLNDPVVDVVMAEHESRWYLLTEESYQSDARWFRLHNVMNEVYARLGIEQYDPDHRVVNYPTTRFDGHVGGDFGGAWMDGDDITCTVTGLTYPYRQQDPAYCLAHPVHELGHVMGLDHTGPEYDCMQLGFYTDYSSPMCTISADNVRRILGNPLNDGWFEATPGERCTGR